MKYASIDVSKIDEVNRYEISGEFCKYYKKVKYDVMIQKNF